jgi:DHA2 family multidrug resistance protein
MPLSQTVMLDIYPPQQIPQVMSIWSAAVIMGPIVGPVLGGWLTENLSWRWVFYINLPIGILAFLGVYVFMARDRGGLQRPFDFLGFGALITFIGAFQVMMDRGPSQDWFDSPEIWAEAGIALAGLCVFIVQTLTAEHPFFHRDLAKDRNFVSSTFFGLFVGAMLFSTTALLPSFMQTLLGYSALQSGYASMPRGLGSLIAFLLVPLLIARAGARQVLVVGVAVSVVALWQMGRFDLSMTATPIMIAGLVQGFGTGLLFAPLNTLGYVSLDISHRTEGTIVATMARSLGGSVGISLLQATLIRDSALAHARLAERIGESDPIVRGALPSALDPASPVGLLQLNAEVTRQASMIGYDTIFSWMALMTFALVPLIFIMRSPRLASAPTREIHGD